MNIHCECRTCGEIIYNLNAKNLFHHEKLLQQIKALTGLWLVELPDLPQHICACCIMDLKHAISFRERCISTQQSLMREKNKSELDDGETDYAELDEPSDDCQDEAEVPPKSSPTRPKSSLRMVDVVSLAKAARSSSRFKATTANQLAKTMAMVHEKRKQLFSQMVKTETSKQTGNGVPLKGRKPTDCVCDQCGRRFNDRSNLKVHLLRHSGVKKFECTQCDSKFVTSHLLNLHIRVRHEGEKPYACKQCDERFFTSTARSRHELKHKNQRPYACNMCDKRYLDKSSLNKHVVIHSDVRPYRCKACNISFQRSRNLQIHYRSKVHQKKLEVTQSPSKDIQQNAEIVESEIDYDFNDVIIEELY